MKNFVRLLLLVLAAAFLSVSPVHARSEQMLYDITWLGLSVGRMTLLEETTPDGALSRSLRIQSLPWVSAFHPVDDTVLCRIRPTPDGPCHTVTKIIGENDFAQHDILTLWPSTGRAVWSNALDGTAIRFSTPTGAGDYVSFFCDLRAPGRLALSESQTAVEYQLVMDHAAHALTLSADAPESVRTPHGRRMALPVRAVSKSDVLFSRNRPETVWVAVDCPAVLLADVHTRFGNVRATLREWTRDGIPVEW